MITLGVFSLSLTFVALYCLLLEIITLLKDKHNGVYIHDDLNHTNIHIILTCGLLILLGAIYIEIFLHGGLIHGLVNHLGTGLGFFKSFILTSVYLLFLYHLDDER